MHHSTLRRNFAASCATADHTSNKATCGGTSQGTHCRWTGRTCELSRARSATRWPNTSPSSSWKPSATSNVSIWTPPIRCSDSCCSHSCTQQHRTQTTGNIELLAGTSSIGTRWTSESFSRKQNVFWRRENCFHEAQPRSLRCRGRAPHESV